MSMVETINIVPQVPHTFSRKFIYCISLVCVCVPKQEHTITVANACSNRHNLRPIQCGTYAFGQWMYGAQRHHSALGHPTKSPPPEGTDQHEFSLPKQHQIKISATK